MRWRRKNKANIRGGRKNKKNNKQNKRNDTMQNVKRNDKEISMKGNATRKI